MIPLSIPNTGERERQLLDECVTSGFVSSVGPLVDRFEALVAEISGAAHAVSTSSGTAGLHAALTAVGVKPGDLVAIPTYSFIATANAVAQCGADPLLLDVSADDWTLDIQTLETELAAAKVSDGCLLHATSGRPITAVMAVCTLGWLPDIQALAAVAKRYGLPLVLDAAPAIGATRDQAPLGSMPFDLAVFSFNGNKTVTTGAGGAIIGQDEALMADVKALTTTAKVGTDYSHDRRAFNYRMSNIQAALGVAQLQRLKDFLQRKRDIYQTYRLALDAMPGLSPFPCPDSTESGCWLSGAVMDRGAAEISDVIAHLESQSIACGRFWKPIHLQTPYQACPTGPTAISADIWERVFILPCSTSLSDDDQQTVIAALRGLFA